MDGVDAGRERSAAAEAAQARVDADPSLRAVLRAARAWGVSPGRFLGQAPVEVHVHELDRLGRVVRTRVERAPEWDEHDRALALALEAYEADLCGGCGQPLTATTAPDAEGRYVSGAGVRCHACTAVGQAAQVYADTNQPHALRFPIHYQPPPTEEHDETEAP